MIAIHVPLAKPLPSAANLREHWATKARRVQAQRRQVALYLAVSGAKVLPLIHLLARNESVRVTCTLTRIAPRKLDDDNLAAALKAIRDQVADVLGLDDGSPRWTWAYAQESGHSSYRIELEASSEVAR